MSGSKRLCGILGLGLALYGGLSGAAAADALATLNDLEQFKQAQKDVAAAPRAELDVLIDAVATCSAVSIGQRMQQFECEKQINAYWARYNRGRAIDNYLSALGGLMVGFDNNALNPSGEMMQAYRRTSNDLLTLTKTINLRYRQVDK